MMGLQKAIGQRPWLIIPMASALHYTYASALLMEPSVSRITAVHLIERWLDNYAPLALAFVATLALVPMFKKMRAENIHLCLWPQQTLLFLMSASAIHATITGSYPDGTVRPFWFIAADQCYTVIFTVGHLAATIRNALLGRT